MMGLRYEAVEKVRGANQWDGRYAVEAVDVATGERYRVATFDASMARSPRAAAADYADWSNRQHAEAIR